jgi:hypothetical protein
MARGTNAFRILDASEDRVMSVAGASRRKSRGMTNQGQKNERQYFTGPPFALGVWASDNPSYVIG